MFSNSTQCGHDFLLTFSRPASQSYSQYQRIRLDDSTQFGNFPRRWWAGGLLFHGREYDTLFANDPGQGKYTTSRKPPSCELESKLLKGGYIGII